MRHSFKFSALALGALCLSAGASAASSLIAVGSLSGVADLSGLNYSLESGVAANILGGLGSGLAYAGNNTFLSLPDRGPNADVYNCPVPDDC